MINWFKHNWDKLLLIFVFAGAVFIRVKTYGNPFASIGMNDTPGYIESAQQPLLSWQFFTSQRPPTVPFLYKIFQPQSGYELKAVSSPAAIGKRVPLSIQPGFTSVVFSQMLLSILGWCLLVWVVFKNLKSRPIRLAAALLILFFAFSPQLADWDMVLSSESLTFSLFAFVLALTIELTHRLTRQGAAISPFTWVLFGLWFLSFIFWVFTRDANAYMIPVTLILLVVWLYFVLRNKNKRGLIGTGLVIIFMAALLFFQQTTMNQSTRWEKPFIANLIGNVLHYESRLEYFVKQGMPYSEDLGKAIRGGVRKDDYTNFPEFMTWMKSKGVSTYTRFLMNNPFWAAWVIFRDKDGFFVTNLQPYFSADSNTRPAWFETVGNMFHPLSSVIILIDLLLTGVILLVALHRPEKDIVAWALIFGWLFLGEILLLFVSYHGDFYSQNRHVLAALVPMRLSMWLLIITISDIALR